MQFMELTESEYWKGYEGLPKARPIDWPMRLARFVRLLENERGWSHRVHMGRLEEAMAAADFPTLFGDVLDREILAGFQQTPAVMSKLLRYRTPANFETVRRSGSDGIVQTLPKVPQSGPYGKRTKPVLHYTYNLEKYGITLDITWDAFLRDVDGFFDDIVPGLVKSAVQTKERFATELFWDSTGPVSAYFAHATRGNTAIADLPLTQANLNTAITAMTSGAGYRILGEPVMIEPKYLVTGSALRLTAEAILNAIYYGSRANATVSLAAAGTADQGIELIVNPWVDLVDTTSGSTSWALFAGNIPPGEIGELKGHEAPEVFMRHPGAVRVGGGDANPFDGGYENDEIGYKVRYCLGGTTLDPIAGYASDGVA
jgi:hypothetical protein